MASPELHSGQSRTWPGASLTWLLELYEYQVSDLLAGREPRGGERNLRELRGRLRQFEWPAPLRRRLIRADRQYSAWQADRQARATEKQRDRGRPVTAQRTGPPATVPGWAPPVTHNAEEAAAWAELRQLAWHADLMAEMYAVTQELRHEPGRPTLRVLYAVTENAERAARRLPTPFPVPGPHDPLVSLGNSEVVRQLTRTLGDMLLLPGGAAQVWQALDRVQDNPFPPQPGDDALHARLSAIRQGGGSARERGELEEALRASAGPQSELRGDPRERPALRGAAQAIRRWLLRRLERAPGQLPGTVPAHSVLYAQEPGSALAAPPAGDGLTLHLGGPERLAHWQGLRLSWRSLGPNWQLLVQDAAGEADGQPVRGGQLALLRPELPASERQLLLEVGGQQLQVLFSGDYALLRRRSDEARTRRLGRLAALGRACALLLLPENHHGRLRLARALVRRLRGDPPRADGAQSGRWVADPLAAARRSLHRLEPLLGRFTAAEVFREAQVAQALLDLPPHYAAQVQRAAEHAATATEPLREPFAGPGTRTTDPTFLNANGQFVVFPLSSESAARSGSAPSPAPLELRLPGERLLTLRTNHQAELMAVLPGQAAAPVGDLLVLPLHDLSVVVVREGPQVAVCALLPGLLETAPWP